MNDDKTSGERIQIRDVSGRCRHDRKRELGHGFYRLKRQIYGFGFADSCARKIMESIRGFWGVDGYPKDEDGLVYVARY